MRSSTSTSPGHRRAGRRETGRAEDAEHAVVVAEDLGREAADPVAATEGGEVLQQQAAEATAPVLVGDQEGDLGAVGGRAPRRSPVQRRDRGRAPPARPTRCCPGRRGGRRSDGLPPGWARRIATAACPPRPTRAARGPRHGPPSARTGSLRSCRRRGARPPARRSSLAGRRSGHLRRSRHQRARAHVRLPVPCAHLGVAPRTRSAFGTAQRGFVSGDFWVGRGGPPPVPDLLHVLAVRLDVDLVLDQLVLQLLARRPRTWPAAGARGRSRRWPG